MSRVTSVDKLREFLPHSITLVRVSRDGRTLVFKVRERYLTLKLERHVYNYPVSRIVRLLLWELSHTPIVYVSREELVETLQG